MHRPGVEIWSQVRRPNHYNTKPPKVIIANMSWFADTPEAMRLSIMEKNVKVASLVTMTLMKGTSLRRWQRQDTDRSGGNEGTGNRFDTAS